MGRPVVARMWLFLDKSIGIDEGDISWHGFVTSTIALVHAAVRASCGKFGEQLTRERRFLQ